jgi:hypothetical protein
MHDAEAEARCAAQANELVAAVQAEVNALCRALSLARVTDRLDVDSDRK